jgi:oligoendopeptidase F
VDWTGLDEERVARWYRQLHIFLYPFYYIEYGIAQIGALQVWRNSLDNPVEAVAQYREALALGAVHSLPMIYRTAGAELTFDETAIGELVALVEREIGRIRSKLPTQAGTQFPHKARAANRT